MPTRFMTLLGSGAVADAEVGPATIEGAPAVPSRLPGAPDLAVEPFVDAEALLLRLGMPREFMA